MTIQDLTNILTVMEEKSINKAAAKLFTSQPSLSKCIKKVEREYGILLFQRSKGSALIPTKEGLMFREMAENILHRHSLFVHQLEQQRAAGSNWIVLGTTVQRAHDLSGPVMKWICDHYPGYYMEVQTYPSWAVRDKLIAGAIDIALLGNIDEDPQLYACPLAQSEISLYLRKDCPAAALAVKAPGERYPVLDLNYLRGEPVVDNVNGTGSRRILKRVMEKSGVTFHITEQTVHSLRVAMADAGLASMFLSGDALAQVCSLDQDRLYALPQEQKVWSITHLVCRKGFEHNRKFMILAAAFREYYGKIGLAIQ